jgi:hypothetical protein
MWDSLAFLLLIVMYILVSSFAAKLISKVTLKLNIYFRLIVLSFCYALFWGIGIFYTGGDPGFGFPAPNIIAIGIMVVNGFCRGIMTGLSILGIWWTVFFGLMLVRFLITKKAQVLVN